MLRIREFSDLHELVDLGDGWNRILEKSKDNTVFSTWEWLSSWWEHFGKGRQLRVLVAQDGDEIVGIAPLMLSNYTFIGQIRKLEFVTTPLSDYNNFILLRKGEQCMRMFLRHLMAQTDWDFLQFTDIREGTESWRLLWDVGVAGGFGLEHKVSTLCPYIELPSSVEEFASSLPRKIRRDLRGRQMRRLAERYRVGTKTYADFGSIDEAMGILFDLHERRWRTKREVASLADKTVQDFNRTVARLFAEKGWLSLNFLTANDDPIASIYSFGYRKKNYAYQSGFDPRFARYSVGSLAHLCVMESCIRKGLTEYDFMRGDEQYKLWWHAKVRKNFEVQLVRKGWLAKAYRQLTRKRSLLALARKLHLQFQATKLKT